MFLLFFSIGTKIRPLGETAVRACPRCGNAVAWQRLERWRHLSLFFIPLLRWRRERLEACPICGELEPARERAAAPSPRARHLPAT